ncbi:hypothetical protein BJ138DRAFT_1157568 [Hygrophoropsis aurantiaca]|uniref:Uncharacterized protein n=1 Tax=Hygrophoropsis aurantiaca TaxID=72124 RepID=A0ACB8A4V3_9AGAM|nr:hypothetical protein BJ138DRAFT_1157568 [Hygrophoropsis aurantiaca]
MGNHTGHYYNSIRTTIRVIENEVLELRKQELDLLTQLRPLQDTIARKCTLAGSLKNSLAPVSRLPNEILLACFGQAVQDWVDKNDGVDEQAVVELEFCEWPKDAVELPCTPIFAISHVSHHWRQLAINAPSLWTNLIITPKFEFHLDVFRDFLHRTKGIPIAANLRSFESERMLSSAVISLMEAIIPLIHAQQVHALAFLASGPALPYLLSRMVEQTTNTPTSPPSIAFSSLTSLSIFGPRNNPEGLTLSHLRYLLSAAPQLKTLELQHNTSLDAVERADESVIGLPMLENLTIIESNVFVCNFLGLLSASNLSQLKLNWDDLDQEDVDVTSCLFINNSDSSLRVPRFPGVQNLTLSTTPDYNCLHINLISAFPRITHLSLGSPSLFYETSVSPVLPTFNCLECLTFDFAFAQHMDWWDSSSYTWLPKPEDPMDRPLLISVFDRSTESKRDLENSDLFRYYKKLQQYGTLDKSSSSLDEFMCWYARVSADSPECNTRTD